MPLSTPPSSDLPPQSQPWGRWAEAGVEEAQSGLQSVRNDIANMDRINNSTLDNLASQVREVGSRTTNRWSWASQATPMLSNTSYVMTIPDSIIPPPGDIARWGWINFNVYLTQSASAFTNAVVGVRVDNNLLAMDAVPVPPQPGWPVSLGDFVSVSVMSAFHAAPDAPSKVQVTVNLDISGTTSRFITVNLAGTVQYAQPYLPS